MVGVKSRWQTHRRKAAGAYDARALIREGSPEAELERGEIESFPTSAYFMAE
jgi:hypothetical protein